MELDHQTNKNGDNNSNNNVSTDIGIDNNYLTNNSITVQMVTSNFSDINTQEHSLMSYNIQKTNVSSLRFDNISVTNFEYKLPAMTLENRIRHFYRLKMHVFPSRISAIGGLRQMNAILPDKSYEQYCDYYKGITYGDLTVDVSAEDIELKVDLNDDIPFICNKPGFSMALTNSLNNDSNPITSDHTVYSVISNMLSLLDVATTIGNYLYVHAETPVVDVKIDKSNIQMNSLMVLDSNNLITREYDPNFIGSKIMDIHSKPYTNFKLTNHVKDDFKRYPHHLPLIGYYSNKWQSEAFILNGYDPEKLWYGVYHTEHYNTSILKHLAYTHTDIVMDTMNKNFLAYYDTLRTNSGIIIDIYNSMALQPNAFPTGIHYRTVYFTADEADIKSLVEKYFIFPSKSYIELFTSREFIVPSILIKAQNKTIDLFTTYLSSFPYCENSDIDVLFNQTAISISNSNSVITSLIKNNIVNIPQSTIALYATMNIFAEFYNVNIKDPLINSIVQHYTLVEFLHDLTGLIITKTLLYRFLCFHRHVWISLLHQFYNKYFYSQYSQFFRNYGYGTIIGSQAKITSLASIDAESEYSYALELYDVDDAPIFITLSTLFRVNISSMYTRNITSNYRALNRYWIPGEAIHCSVFNDGNTPFVTNFYDRIIEVGEMYRRYLSVLKGNLNKNVYNTYTNFNANAIYAPILSFANWFHGVYCPAYHCVNNHNLLLSHNQDITNNVGVRYYIGDSGVSVSQMNRIIYNIDVGQLTNLDHSPGKSLLFFAHAPNSRYKCGTFSTYTYNYNAYDIFYKVLDFENSLNEYQQILIENYTYFEAFHLTNSIFDLSILPVGATIVKNMIEEATYLQRAPKAIYSRVIELLGGDVTTLMDMRSSITQIASTFNKLYKPTMITLINGREIVSNIDVSQYYRKYIVDNFRIMFSRIFGDEGILKIRKGVTYCGIPIDLPLVFDYKLPQPDLYLTNVTFSLKVVNANVNTTTSVSVYQFKKRSDNTKYDITCDNYQDLFSTLDANIHIPHNNPVKFGIEMDVFLKASDSLKEDLLRSIKSGVVMLTLKDLYFMPRFIYALESISPSITLTADYLERLASLKSSMIRLNAYDFSLAQNTALPTSFSPQLVSSTDLQYKPKFKQLDTAEENNPIITQGLYNQNDLNFGAENRLYNNNRKLLVESNPQNLTSLTQIYLLPFTSKIVLSVNSHVVGTAVK